MTSDQGLIAMASDVSGWMAMSILRAGVLSVLAASPVATQTVFPFFAGVDSTGRAQAVSNAAGRVMIESPEFPRGMWLDLADEEGKALADIRVEYQGRPDSLVAIHCIDPSGSWQETLLWTRPVGGSLQLMIEPRKSADSGRRNLKWEGTDGSYVYLSSWSNESADLPTQLSSLVWQIDPSAEESLEWENGPRLANWQEGISFLQERWHGQAGRVSVELDGGTATVDLGDTKAMGALVEYLQGIHETDTAWPSPLGTTICRADGFHHRELIVFHVRFKDKHLERTISRLFGRPSGHITRGDALSTTYMYAFAVAENIAGLEHFESLGALGLTGGQISDVSPLASLTKLDQLQLTQNQISDLSPLAALSNLRILWLPRNPISDLSPLASLTRMEDLSLHGNRQIADWSPLATMTNLRVLRAGGGGIDDGDLASIAAAATSTDLAYLILPGNQIMDVAPLAAMTNLRELLLDDNEIADVSPLANLPDLWLLELSRNQIVDFRPLAPWSALEEVYLAKNPLSDRTINEAFPVLRARGILVDHLNPRAGYFRASYY